MTVRRRRISDIYSWARDASQADVSVDGLAALERELFQEYPEVQATIALVVDEFEPLARDIAGRHDGQRLMKQVQARRHQDWRASRSLLAGTLAFLVVLLPAFALATVVRGPAFLDPVDRPAAALLGTTAVVCLILLATTLRDHVWVGVRVRWLIGGSVASVLTVIRLIVIVAGSGDEPVIPLSICVLSLAVLVGVTALGVSRQVRASQRIEADLAEIQPAVDSYLEELGPLYNASMARVRKAVSTIDVRGTVDAKNQKRLRRQRNAVISSFTAGRGLGQGHVPVRISRKELGELQLFAVAEPLLGGGPYPVWGRKARR